MYEWLSSVEKVQDVAREERLERRERRGGRPFMSEEIEYISPATRLSSVMRYNHNNWGGESEALLATPFDEANRRANRGKPGSQVQYELQRQ